MFDWIRGFFGKGTVYIAFKGIDASGKIVKGTAKLPYVGEYDEDDVLDEFKHQILKKHNIVVFNYHITSHDKVR